MVQSQAEEDGCWEVLFIDYGNREVVSSTELVPLMKELSLVPVIALPCQLHGVQPVEGTEWNFEACKMFSDVLIDAKVVVTLKVL